MRAETAKPADGKGWRPPIAAALTLGFGLLMAISLGIVIWFGFGTARSSTYELIRDRSKFTLTSVSGRVEEHISAVSDMTEEAALRLGSLSASANLRQRRVDILWGAMTGVPQVAAIYYVDAEARITAVDRHQGDLTRFVSTVDQRNEIRRLMPRIALSREPMVVGPHWSEVLGETILTVYFRVLVDGEFEGFVGAITTLSELSNAVDRIGRDLGLVAFILSDPDHVLAHPALASANSRGEEIRRLPRLTEIADPVLPHLWTTPLEDLRWLYEGLPIAGRVIEGKAGRFIVIYQILDLIPNQTWYVGAWLPAETAGIEIRRLRDAGFIALGVVALAILLTLLLGRMLSIPIKRLAEASRAIERLAVSEAEPLPSSLFRELESAGRAFNAMLSGLRLFEIYVPKTLVQRLLARGKGAAASEAHEVSVLFTDITNFTSFCEGMAPVEITRFINRHFTLLGAAVAAEEGEIDKYIGDSLMAFWGAPIEQPDHAVRACRAAIAMRQAIAAENEQRRAAGERPLGLRIGIHSGPVVVGNIGAPNRVNYTLIGDTVNAAQRIESLGKEIGERDEDCVVLVSGDTRELAGEGFSFASVGRHRLRGRQQKTEIFELTGLAQASS